MDLLNKVLTLPGKISANIIHGHLGVVCGVLILLVASLAVMRYRTQKREYGHLALIGSSIVLALIPAGFGFARADSVIFWVFVVLAVDMGFIFYIKSASDPLEIEDDINSMDHSKIPTASSMLRNPVVLFFFLLMVFALYLRTFQLEQYPAGYSHWELDKPVDLILYEQGQYDFKHFLSLFKNEEIGLSKQSPLIMALAYPFYKIFGISMVTGRYFSVLWGMAGLLFLFLYLRRRFSFEVAVYLIVFVSLGLINVAFSRTAFQNITAFTYSAFVLYLMEITFKPRKLSYSIAWAALFGLALFGSLYMYLSTRAIIAVVLIILGYRALLDKSFLPKYKHVLGVFIITFACVVWIYTGGELRTLWPRYPGYVGLEKGTSWVRFLLDSAAAFIGNIQTTLSKIIFEKRAIESDSPFAPGGLLTGPALALTPFALGCLMAALRKEKYFAMSAIVAITLLPAMLSGVPNARRLLLPLSFLLILPGITLYLISHLSQRLFRGEARNRVIHAPMVAIVLLFSYNLFIYIDIHDKQRMQNSVTLPFAESGFADMRYSRYTTELARKISRFIKNNNVFYYYSNVYDENSTGPNGTQEQFMVESYENGKKGGRLVWMNAFYQNYHGPLEKPYFYDLETVVKMILDSERDVKIIFLKPLDDERSILHGLTVLFPGAQTIHIPGDIKTDSYDILTITKAEIDRAKPVSLGDSRIGNSEKFDSNALTDLLREAMKNGITYDKNIWLDREVNLILKHNMLGLFDLAIDDRVIDKPVAALFLAKGIHRIKLTTRENQPFSMVELNAAGSKEFSAPVVGGSEAFRRMRMETTEFYPKRLLIARSIKYGGAIYPHAFYYNESGRYLYSVYGKTLDDSGSPVITDDGRHIVKILQKGDRTYVIRSNDVWMISGGLTIYGPDMKLLKDIAFEGCPYDLFLGPRGELYVTLMSSNHIAVVYPDFRVEEWDMSKYSRFPIWNGDVDDNGDIALLSSDRMVYLFDKNRKPFGSFPVQGSWEIVPYIPRTGGGLAVSKGLIHVLDPYANKVNSYNKNGRRLYNDYGPTILELPQGQKIQFIQKWGGSLALIGPGSGGNIVLYSNKPNLTPISNSMPLWTLTPMDVAVGWGTYTHDAVAGLTGTVNKQEYDRYIFAHAPSHAAYFLNGNFKRLSIKYGLDDIGGKDTGSVQFIIKGDDRVLHSSPLIRSMTPIQGAEINVMGVIKLELIVDSTPDGYASDEAVWIEPILTR